MGLLIVSPYLAYVAFPKASRSTFAWAWSSARPNSIKCCGASRADTGGGRAQVVSAAAEPGGPAAVDVFRGGPGADRPAVHVERHTGVAPEVALWFFTVAFRVVISPPLRARLPDVAVVAALGGANRSCALLRRLPVWWRTRPALAVAATAVALAFAAVGLEPLDCRQPQRSPGTSRPHSWRRRCVASARGVLLRGAAGTWDPYWPAGDIPPVVDYLTRCTRPADHLLITWFAPEYFCSPAARLRRGIAILPGVVCDRARSGGHARAHTYPDGPVRARQRGRPRGVLAGIPAPVGIYRPPIPFAHVFPATTRTPQSG